MIFPSALFINHHKRTERQRVELNRIRIDCDIEYQIYGFLSAFSCAHGDCCEIHRIQFADIVYGLHEGDTFCLEHIYAHKSMINLCAAVQ